MTDDDRRASLTPHVNPVTRGLREGRVCLGALGISFITPAAAQIFANAGFSWYYLDMEHSQLFLRRGQRSQHGREACGDRANRRANKPRGSPCGQTTRRGRDGSGGSSCGNRSGHGIGR